MHINPYFEDHTTWLGISRTYRDFFLKSTPLFEIIQVTNISNMYIEEKARTDLDDIDLRNLGARNFIFSTQKDYLLC